MIDSSSYQMIIRLIYAYHFNRSPFFEKNNCCLGLHIPYWHILIPPKSPLFKANIILDYNGQNLNKTAPKNIFDLLERWRCICGVMRRYGKLCWVKSQILFNISKFEHWFLAPKNTLRSKSRNWQISKKKSAHWTATACNCKHWSQNIELLST